MTRAPHNDLKAKLKAGAVTRGIWLNFHSDAVTEMAGHSGADWCLIDGEHAPYDPTSILRQLRVLAGTPAHVAVRVPDSQSWMLKQVLDLGVQTVLVPMVETPEDARAIVAACRYPPKGKRGVGHGVARSGGYGRLPDYKDTADDEICIIVQAEAGRALDNIEAIAAVDGIDGIFIGPADLAADLGTGPEAVSATIEDALGRIAATGVVPGILTDRAGRDGCEAAGSRMTCIGTDTGLMLHALRGVFE